MKLRINLSRKLKLVGFKIAAMILNLYV